MNVTEEKGSFVYLREFLAMPVNQLHDLVGKAWAFFYLMVSCIVVATMVNKLPGVEIKRIINGVTVVTLLGCLGVAIKTSPNLKGWTSPGRAELLGIVSVFGLILFLVSSI